MVSPLNPNMAATFGSPIVESRRWLEGVTFPADRPLINVSQAAPMVPPPLPLREALADIVINDTDAHLYGAVLGLDGLRAEIARQWTQQYGAPVAASQVAITAGCNQAFTSVMGTIAGPGDEVILPTPWYFNHKMHLDMTGAVAVPLPCDDSMIPSAEAAATLVTDRTRAIVLISPNNPSGAEYPAETLLAFFELARTNGIALIVDETYKDFDSRPGPVHTLFSQDGWQDTLIQLYSFSKAYRLTGHRVGAIVTSADRLLEVEKYMDTVQICASQIGQRAALWGMQNLSQWLAGERAEILARRAAIENGFSRLKDWKLLGLGGFFAYVEHPFSVDAETAARRIVQDAGVLLLPGTMFRPAGDPRGAREFRIAFANIDSAEIATLFGRLEKLAF